MHKNVDRLFISVDYSKSIKESDSFIAAGRLFEQRDSIFVIGQWAHRMKTIVQRDSRFPFLFFFFFFHFILCITNRKRPVLIQSVDEEEEEEVETTTKIKRMPGCCCWLRSWNMSNGFVFNQQRRSARLGHLSRHVSPTYWTCLMMERMEKSRAPRLLADEVTNQREPAWVRGIRRTKRTRTEPATDGWRETSERRWRKLNERKEKERDSPNGPTDAAGPYASSSFRNQQHDDDDDRHVDPSSSSLPLSEPASRFDDDRALMLFGEAQPRRIYFGIFFSFLFFFYSLSLSLFFFIHYFRRTYKKIKDLERKK